MATENEEFEDMTVDEAVEYMYGQLPAQVQEFLVSPERGAIARELSAKYSLRVDQAGKFERAFMFMLLGIASPEEFVSMLLQAGIGQDAVNGLATDVNARVFIRLRDAQRPVSAPQPAQASLNTPMPMKPPTLDYAPASGPTLPGSPVAAPMPAPVAPAAPVLATLEPTPQPEPQSHVVHAMPSAPQQGWHPAAAVHIFVPTQGPHAVPAQPQPMPAAPIPAPAPEAPAFAPPAPAGFVNPERDAVPAPTERPLTKDYAADPYREPI